MIKFNISCYIAVLFVLILAISCSQPEPNEPTVAPVEVTVSPPPPDVDMAVPESTLSPTATTSVSSLTPTAGPDLPRLAINGVEIADCRISGSLGGSGFSSVGTAPAPTPTPVSQAHTRPEETVAAELQELRIEINPVVGALLTYDQAFKSAWHLADRGSEQAAQLHTYGNRLAQLCAAVSQPGIPPEAFGLMVGLSESIRARYAWVLVALEELECCGDARTLFMKIGFEDTSTAIKSATSKMTEYFESNSIKVSSDSTRVVLIDRFGMSLDLPPTAAVMRNTIDLLIVFTDLSELLDPASLGPEGWGNGTAFRIRRLRNRSDLSVEQAAIELEGIIGRFGDSVRSDDLDVTEFDEIQFSILSSSESWVETTSVFVHDGHSYIVELMCVGAGRDICDLVRSSVESVRLAP